MYMLDTNICIYALKTHSRALLRKFRVHRELCVSAVTWAELCFGVANSPPSKHKAREQQLAEFARRLSILPLDESVGTHYGLVRARLKREGRLIGPNDLLIAAHALAAECTLVSNNVREFERVEGLSVENWA